MTILFKKKPEGIAQSLIICEEWINNSSVALILGDNLFFGPDFNELIIDAINKNQGSTIFCIESNTPERFGVIDFDEKSNILSIEEKPENLNQIGLLQVCTYMIIMPHH